MFLTICQNSQIAAILRNTLLLIVVWKLHYFIGYRSLEVQSTICYLFTVKM